MDYKDYYQLLGVSRSATEKEIKQAYRQLAQKYHPDHNPGDKASEEKFKDINEAYQVLSDPEKRARYNQLGESYSRWQQRGAPAGGFNWDDWVTTAPGGSYRQVDNLDDLLGGSFSEFFRRIFGGMPGGMPDMGNPQQRRSANRRTEALPNVEQPVTISLTEAFHGGSRLIEIDNRRLEVKIPPGARTGLKIRVADAIPNPQSNKKQDLYLVIQVADDPRFERKGDNLYTNIPVDLYTAILGGEVTVPTMTGNVVLSIPEGTQPDQLFRLTGRGMPHLKNPTDHGDLFARIKVKIPRSLSKQQKELFQQLARS